MIRQRPFHTPNEAFGKKASDRSIVWGFRFVPVDLTAPRTIPFIESSDAGPVCTGRRRETSIWLSIQIRVRVFPLPHTVSRSYHHDGPKIPATERSRRCSIEVEQGYRGSKPGEGGIKHHSGQDCFWFNQRPPPHNQSRLLLIHVQMSITWLICAGFNGQQKGLSRIRAVLC